jgi:hypothetical protein
VCICMCVRVNVTARHGSPCLLYLYPSVSVSVNWTTQRTTHNTQNLEVPGPSMIYRAVRTVPRRVVRVVRLKARNRKREQTGQAGKAWCAPEQGLTDTRPDTHTIVVLVSLFFLFLSRSRLHIRRGSTGSTEYCFDSYSIQNYRTSSQT